VPAASFADCVSRVIASGRGEALLGDGACSWHRIGALAGALAAHLHAAGVLPRQRVAVLMRNRTDHVGVVIALFACDVCPVIVNAQQGAGRITEELARLAPAAVLGHASDLAMTGAPTSTHIAIDEPPRLVHIARPEGLTGDKVIDLPTSGTTGTPKRMAFAAQVVFAAASNMAAMFDEAEGTGIPHCDRTPVLVPYPMANMSGLAFALYCATHGRRLFVLERFEVASWLAAATAIPQTVIYLPPVAIRMLLDAHVQRDVFATARVVRTGAAPLDDAVRDRFERTYGVPVISHYGASEFCGAVVSFPLAAPASVREARRGSVGIARDGNRLRVVDALGTPLPPGRTGLLEVQADRLGPQWVRTTDLAHLDADGYLFLHGRADDAINRGGFKIVPETIAEVFRRHPKVADAAATAMPDPRVGEVPMVAVEARPGAQVNAEDLLRFARASLIAYQVPVRVLLVASLPRTVGLKVDRAALKKLFLDNP